MSVDRIAAYYANGGGNGHSIKSVKGVQQSNGVFPLTTGWARYNSVADLVWIDDAEGHPRALTPKQYTVLRAILEIIENGSHPTMRAVAERIGTAPSTVSRAMTKLAAWGLIRYIVGRGRYAGMLIFRAIPNDGLERLRRVARARIRRWHEAAERRISRLRFNVAPRDPVKDGVSVQGSNTVGATLTAQPFSVDDLRDVGII